MAREDLVLKKVKKILKDNGIFFIRSNPSVGTGVPDVIACVRGRFTAIEVKDDIQGPYSVTDAQKMRIAKIRGNEGKIWIVDKNNIGEFERWIKDES